MSINPVKDAFIQFMQGRAGDVSKLRPDFVERLQECGFLGQVSSNGRVYVRVDMVWDGELQDVRRRVESGEITKDRDLVPLLEKILQPSPIFAAIGDRSVAVQENHGSISTGDTIYNNCAFPGSDDSKLNREDARPNLDPNLPNSKKRFPRGVDGINVDVQCVVNAKWDSPERPLEAIAKEVSPEKIKSITARIRTLKAEGRVLLPNSD